MLLAISNHRRNERNALFPELRPSHLPPTHNATVRNKCHLYNCGFLWRRAVAADFCSKWSDGKKNETNAIFVNAQKFLRETTMLLLMVKRICGGQPCCQTRPLNHQRRPKTRQTGRQARPNSSSGRVLHLWITQSGRV